MKIIGTDNFARESVADFLVAENIKVAEFAAVMCAALNAKFCKDDDAPTYYIVIADDFRLSRGMEDIM